MLTKTGYLMRTTAVYGNGKFGISDHERIADRPILGGAFMAEMLAVWLIRGFTHDLAEHLGGLEINRETKRHLGVGNATGLGMAPYLVSHPHLIDGWIKAREIALARVLSLKPNETNHARMSELCDRAIRHLDEWHVDDPDAMSKIMSLRHYARELKADIAGQDPVGEIMASAPNVQAEELLSSLLIEAHPEHCDDLAPLISSADAPKLDPAMSMGDLMDLIETEWRWAKDITFDDPKSEARFWYVSEEKLEPRIGDRFNEPGAALESPLDIARRVSALTKDLNGRTGSLAEFLASHPSHREAVARVQSKARFGYGEIHDNLIAGTCRPIDMLRSKLAVFGATKFDPKSDLWTRITLAQGAPLLDELHTQAADDWWLAAAS